MLLVSKAYVYLRVKLYIIPYALPRLRDGAGMGEGGNRQYINGKGCDAGGWIDCLIGDGGAAKGGGISSWHNYGGRIMKLRNI